MTSWTIDAPSDNTEWVVDVQNTALVNWVED